MQHRSVMHGSIGLLPAWVPDSASHYLEHTENGTSIRALARRAGCHASTILRQVRKFETKRDDLLVDAGLRRLGRQVLKTRKAGSPTKETWMNSQAVFSQKSEALTEGRLKTEGRRILRRLCETGAVLAVAADMDKAVVLRETAQGDTTRTAIVDREIAEAMALKEWIAGRVQGRVAKYHITGAGRSALNRMLAEAENKALGFAEAQMLFVGQGPGVAHSTIGDDRDADGPGLRNMLAETPLTALARRKDRDGNPFLSKELVAAGERLREDFELSQLGLILARNWDRLLTEAEVSFDSEACHKGTDAARCRVTGALRDLGPGLGDVVLRCCCLLEGLEKAEKRMGWSARSGKIVLRIALQRLKRHYESLGEAGNLMG